ncbi:hypothetical protein HispidOSU_021751, partial [Sigmodon hispidus]
RHTAPKQTTLLDFEDIVEDLGLNKTDIIHPKYDDNEIETLLILHFIHDFL